MYADDNMSRPVSIPHDIVSDILTRLPVKTLTQFRSVSTQWNSTITHPSFCKSHYSRASGRPGNSVTLVLTFINRFNSERTIFTVTIPPNQTQPIPKPTHVLTIPGFAHPFVSLLHGLICFNLGAMSVCNPSTRKFIKLPWTQTETINPSSLSTRHRANAFGYDPILNAHKVLDTWVTFMVAFDVNREVFNFISLCDNDISNSEETVLMELDGHLTIVDHQGLTSGEKNVIQMWVLTDVKDSKWVKKRVDIPAKYSEINDRLRFKFAGTTFSGEMIFAEKSLVNPFHVFFYDIKKNEARKVEICGLTDFEFSYSNVLMNVTSASEHVETIKSLT
nr:hypothetical protein [Tanacetum cinerariifolium]